MKGINLQVQEIEQISIRIDVKKPMTIILKFMKTKGNKQFFLKKNLECRQRETHYIVTYKLRKIK